MISLLSLQAHGNLAPVILSFSVLVLIAQRRPHTEYNDAIRVSNYTFEEVRHPMYDSSHSKRNPYHCKSSQNALRRSTTGQSFMTMSTLLEEYGLGSH